MANAIYPLWKQALMREVDTRKSLDQGTLEPGNGVYVALVDTSEGAGYVYSENHQFYSTVTHVIGLPALVGNATVNGRIFAGDTLVYTNVTGPKIGAFVMYRANIDTDATGWRLVLYEDTGIVGLPMVPSGGNIIVSWNVQGIFGL